MTLSKFLLNISAIHSLKFNLGGERGCKVKYQSPST